MPPANLDQLRLAYKQATDEWIAAIRAEEALATPDHSMTAWEKWTTLTSANTTHTANSPKPAKPTKPPSAP
jgi:hypothetical protein